MKLLFDANLSHKLVSRLSDVFPGSSHVRMIGSKKESDLAIWDYARDHGFTVVTLDEDFYDLSCYLGPPPKVIWLRIGNQATSIYEKIFRDQSDFILRFGIDPDIACLELTGSSTEKP